MIQEALSVQRDKGGQIGQVLIELGRSPGTTLLQHGARAPGRPGDPRPLHGELHIPDLLDRVDANTAKMFNGIPVREEPGKLVVAHRNPMNTAVLDDIWSS